MRLYIDFVFKVEALAKQNETSGLMCMSKTQGQTLGRACLVTLNNPVASRLDSLGKTLGAFS